MNAKLGPIAIARLADEKPRPLLLDAWTRGRYAAQVCFRTDNPYRDDPEMAAAWLKGWESADRDRSTA